MKNILKFIYKNCIVILYLPTFAKILSSIEDPNIEKIYMHNGIRAN